MGRTRDTSLDAHRTQTRLLRSLPSARRVEVALQMSKEAREITLAGIRSRHPEYMENEARLALFRLLHGDETFKRVWRGQPLLEP